VRIVVGCTHFDNYIELEFDRHVDRDHHHNSPGHDDPSQATVIIKRAPRHRG
jgi:hypothetical protein